ncbi:hypothetical protein K443DRAFT_517906 [Laccaria amethystina LaAM-08-1]|uniref:Uncharacterized protein n=1 Tax=Laccaria amethystina LaAM-08-1 TaxID=1095629 RepID=A0A0C9WTT4_9AGAR|nr:hypothetical protein K443DRAFT_517906 [Laccaria amethystina LaAM-08-1]
MDRTQTSGREQLRRLGWMRTKVQSISSEEGNLVKTLSRGKLQEACLHSWRPISCSLIVPDPWWVMAHLPVRCYKNPKRYDALFRIRIEKISSI